VPVTARIWALQVDEYDSSRFAVLPANVLPAMSVGVRTAPSHRGISRMTDRFYWQDVGYRARGGLVEH
jgi:hypothetical protein